jgi:branched-chain amino acid transport system ATP-binding protein
MRLDEIVIRTVGVTKRFGGLKAIDNLTMELHHGEILGIIGPNGAGKTTLFNLITGFIRPTTGKIFYKGTDTTTLKPSAKAKRGLVRTFQNTVLFSSQTVLENVNIGHQMSAEGFCRTIWNGRGSKNSEERIQEKSIRILEYMDLLPLKNELAGSIPHGHQRALGIAIALAANPEVLLLDEPMAGLNPEETISMIQKVRRLRDSDGITIMLVEHAMRAAMGLSDRIVVLNFGTTIAEGTPEEIQADPLVIQAYLGKKRWYK